MIYNHRIIRGSRYGVSCAHHLLWRAQCKSQTQYRFVTISRVDDRRPDSPPSRRPRYRDDDSDDVDVYRDSLADRIDGIPAVPRIPIRQQLRTWEREHPMLVSPIIELRTISQANNIANQEDIEDGDDFSEPTEDPILGITSDDIRDFGSASTFLRPGDLIEIRNRAGTNIELAIFVREVNNRQSQFYTMSGKWIQKRPNTILFFQPAFVQPEELESLLNFLPGEALPEAMLDRLYTFRNALPRETGAPLIRKMLQFWQESDMQYRELASKLDNIHALVAHPTDTTLLSLSDITSKVVPTSANEDGSYPPSIPYAVHRCLMQDDLGFQAQRIGNFRVWGRFEVTSIKDIKTAGAVINAVRKYQEHQAAMAKSINAHQELPFDRAGVMEFASIAAKVIRQSRQSRDFTEHGMLGPIKSGSKDPSRGSSDPIIAKNDLKSSPASRYFIRFILCWCGFRMFNASPSANSAASAILRATGMYDDVVMDRTTGWTFLQELGFIPPWATRAPFDLRLRNWRYLEDAEGLREDVLADIRKDWGQTPVFCIDAASAKEIDDGVSFEPTENDDEYWIHIHAADPASHITPRSELAMYAQNMASNVYLPETSISMLPKSVVKGRFSLANGRPCLTFSAKVDRTGAFLEHKVTAGRLGNVKYITPAVMAEVIGETEYHDDFERLDIGGETHNDGLERPMLKASDLDNADKESLKAMARFALAHKKYTSRRGAIYTGFNNNSIQVNINNVTPEPTDENYTESREYNGDPSISIAMTEDEPLEKLVRLDPVMHMMLTAGHIAAKWCAERGIPNVFRASQRNPTRQSPIDFYSKEILPYVKSESPIPQNLLGDYLGLLGPVLPSSVPGPHLPIGMSMYSKTTSPLRRYGDMITHWQIGAALLEEHRTGRSLIGNTDQSFLPFTTSDIDAIIPALDSRERALRLHQRTAEKCWTIQALVRAWKYGESKLAKTFTFETRSVNQWRLNGSLPQLSNLWVAVNVGDLPKNISYEDVKPGMRFEVEIQKLNAYTNEVIMKPLRRI